MKVKRMVISKPIIGALLLSALSFYGLLISTNGECRVNRQIIELGTIRVSPQVEISKIVKSEISKHHSDKKVVDEISKYIMKVNKKVSQSEAQKIAVAVVKASEKYNVPKSVILSIIHQESHFNKTAKSKYGCIGLMQINPKVWCRKFQISENELWDIEKNIDTGTRIIKHYYKITGSWKKALYRYYGISEFGKVYQNQTIKRAWKLSWLDKVWKVNPYSGG